MDIFKKKIDDKKQPGREDFATESEKGVAVHVSNADLKRRRAELDLQRIELEQEKERLRIQVEMERLKQQLEELQSYYDEEEPSGSSSEDVLLATLLSKVMTGQQQQQIIPAAAAPQTQPIEVSDDQIKTFWEQQNKLTQGFILNMTVDQIRTEIKNRMPSLTESSTERIVQFIASKKVP